MAAQAAFSDSNDNSSSICCVSNSNNGDSHSNEPFPQTNVAALGRLSDNLESLFLSDDFEFCADARIIFPASDASGPAREIPVHRCILSARSPFFRSLFFPSPCSSSSSAASAAASNSCKEDAGIKIELKDLTQDIDLGFESLFSVLTYLYSGKVRPLPEGVCICVDEECFHVACRPAVDFMVEVLYAAFMFKITELVTMYQRHLLDIIDKVAVDDILQILSVASMCDQSCEKLRNTCIEIVATSLMKSEIDTVTLEKTLTVDIVKKIIDSCIERGLAREDIIFPNKHVRRIHRALDSDDVELVKMLLKEGHTTLDDAYALHYAVAYCDSKITTELLDIDLADVNHKNPRGYSVLHVAAMRREPKIIVSLLTKGARPFDLTSDGRKALQICKRLTKLKDYRSTNPRKCPETPKDKLCIEILEQEERSEPLLGEASVYPAVAGDVRSKLLYLESRVRLAKILFPMEAKVAMDIAQVDRTSSSPFCSSSPTLANESLRMDLNDAPFKLKDEHLARLRALSRTVELGKRYFPRCSEILSDLVDDDELSEIANLESGNLYERELKRQRFNAIQEAFTEAFNKDKEGNGRSNASALSSSSASSTSIRAKSKLTRK